MRSLSAFLLAVFMVSTSPDPAAQRRGLKPPRYGQPEFESFHVVPGQIAAPPSPGAASQPPRDPRQTQAQATGTGIIRGRVLSAENGQPIRRARVSIFAPELR
ncbi:MAG: hypothetical protein ACRD1Q_10085, partial [Vicinamibacterales bacterium]